jgi:hypothetical protein
LGHIHEWAIGTVIQESNMSNLYWHPVVYLVCQCGATKRTVPE